MKPGLAVWWLVPALTLVSIASSQAPPEGNMDAVFGPATRVNQGAGMSDEVRLALQPGPEHAVLAQLVGEWQVEGVAGRQAEPVRQLAEVRALMGGAWFELRLFTDGQLSRLAHLGYDGYRGSYAMWEIGQGFTSPQVRVGELVSEGNAVRFWRRYTIRRRGEDTPVHEQVTVTFVSADVVRWQSFERVGQDAERLQRDVRFTRTPPGG